MALSVAVSLHNSIIARQCPFTRLFGGGHGGFSIPGLATFVTLSPSSLPKIYDNTPSNIHINRLLDTVNKFLPVQPVCYRLDTFWKNIQMLLIQLFTPGAFPAGPGLRAKRLVERNTSNIYYSIQ